MPSSESFSASSSSLHTLQFMPFPGHLITLCILCREAPVPPDLAALTRSHGLSLNHPPELRCYRLVSSPGTSDSSLTSPGSAFGLLLWGTDPTLRRCPSTAAHPHSSLPSPQAPIAGHTLPLLPPKFCSHAPCSSTSYSSLLFLLLIFPTLSLIHPPHSQFTYNHTTFPTAIIPQGQVRRHIAIMA